MDLIVCSSMNFIHILTLLILLFLFRENEAIVMIKKPFLAGSDDLIENFHPRLFYRMPVCKPTELFVKSAQLGTTVDTKLPTKNYIMTHTNSVYSARGLYQVFNQKFTNFDLAHMASDAAQAAGEPVETMTVRNDAQQGTTFQLGTIVEPITGIHKFRASFTLFEMMLRRADMADCSLEPIRVWLDNHHYYEGAIHRTTRLNLDPGLFCQEFVNYFRQGSLFI